MTGEMSQSEVTPEAFPIHFAIAAAIGGNVRAFDQYSGPYVKAAGAKIWLCQDDDGDLWLYDESSDTESPRFPNITGANVESTMAESARTRDGWTPVDRTEKRPVEEIRHAEWGVRAKYPNRHKLERNQVLILAACFARIRPDLPPHGIALDAGRMLAIGTALQALGVARCNYELSARQEARQVTLEKQAQQIAAFYGLKASAGGDPRGYVLHLYGEGLPTGGWGDGFGIG